MASDRPASSISFSSFLAARCANGAKLRNSSTSASVAFSRSASLTHSVAIPPFESAEAGDPARAHDDVLGAGDPDHLLQAGGPARARDHAEPLLGQRVNRIFGDQAEVAGQRQLERDAKAIA